MNKLFPVVQVVVAAILLIAAIATIVNLLLIITRPETISVVNAMIGQGVISIALLALSRILMRKGLKSLRSKNSGPDSGD